MVALLLVLSSCDDDGSAVVPTPPSGTAFVFGMRGIPDSDGQFIAVTSDPAVLAKLGSELALPASERSLHIGGPIARGDGGHNLSWNWHFIPGQWDMVELSIELCDGTPRQVDDDVDAWLNNTQFFCPWTSYVQRKL
jgi:hypothetical protein